MAETCHEQKQNVEGIPHKEAQHRLKPLKPTRDHLYISDLRFHVNQPFVFYMKLSNLPRSKTVKHCRDVPVR